MWCLKGFRSALFPSGNYAEQLYSYPCCLVYYICRKTWLLQEVIKKIASSPVRQPEAQYLTQIFTYQGQKSWIKPRQSLETLNAEQKRAGSEYWQHIFLSDGLLLPSWSQSCPVRFPFNAAKLAPSRTLGTCQNHSRSGRFVHDHHNHLHDLSKSRNWLLQ